MLAALHSTDGGLERFGFRIALVATFLVASTVAAEGASKGEVLWDRYGVPHLYAPDDETLMFLFGRAQMESHADLILRLYGAARGRAAEYWGADFIESDRMVRLLDVDRGGERWLERQSPGWRANIEAFVSGMNAVAEERPELISEHLRRVLPVEPADVLRHAQRVVLLHYVVLPEVQPVLAKKAPASSGSTAWALAPARSESGRTLLLINPHTFWSDLSTYFEAHWVAPGVDFYGASVVGLPTPAFGFNRNLGWAHTVNRNDAADLYALEPAEGGYRFDGEVRAFESERRDILVRSSSGELESRPLVVRSSVHGPVVGVAGGKPIALRVAGGDRSGVLAQYWDMARAGGFEAFEAALQRMQVPAFNVVYADREGRTMFWFGGLTPVRPEGDWRWSGVVPGDRSETLWDEVHGYDEAPRIVDPDSGWLQNANDPPWTATSPPSLSPKDFPDYFVRGTPGMRAQLSAKLLLEDESVSLDEMVAAKHSTRSELADRVLDAVLSQEVAGDEPTTAEALAVLRSWDRTFDAESRGAVLFHEFVRELRRKSPRMDVFVEGWSLDSPLETPRGLSDPKQALEALRAAAGKVTEEYGKLDPRWGDVQRFRRDDVDLPANGAPDSLGVMRVIGFAPDSDGKGRAVAGDSFVLAIEFGRRPRALGLLSYGNASQAGSAHRSDQLELMAAKKLRPIWLRRSEVKANTERRESVRYGR